MTWRYTPHPDLRDDLGDWRIAAFNGRLDGFDQQQPDYSDLLGEVVRILDRQTPGGKAEIIIGGFDTRLDALIQSGTTWAETIDHLPMEVGRCHDNTIQVVHALPGYRVWTGYARNGIEWRAHSCPVSPDMTRMVETTGERDAYFGIVIDAKAFAEVEC